MKTIIPLISKETQRISMLEVLPTNHQRRRVQIMIENTRGLFMNKLCLYLKEHRLRKRSNHRIMRVKMKISQFKRRGWRIRIVINIQAIVKGMRNRSNNL